MRSGRELSRIRGKVLRPGAFTVVSHLHTRQELVNRCIRLCQECAWLCDACQVQSARMELEGSSRCMELCQDASDACLTNARYLGRCSTFARALCAVVAEVCEACAEACDCLLDPEDPLVGLVQVDRCADACRRCARVCREMVTLAA